MEDSNEEDNHKPEVASNELVRPEREDNEDPGRNGTLFFSSSFFSFFLFSFVALVEEGFTRRRRAVNVLTDVLGDRESQAVQVGGL